MKVDAVDTLIVAQEGAIVCPLVSHVPYDQFGSEAPAGKDVGLGRMPLHGPRCA